MTRDEINELIKYNGFKLEDASGNVTYEFGLGDIHRISVLIANKFKN